MQRRGLTGPLSFCLYSTGAIVTMVSQERSNHEINYEIKVLLATFLERPVS